jgi:hypothetical protein
MDETEAFEEPRERIGLRDLFAGVNLRDFFDMVRGEFGLVVSSARAAMRANIVLIPFALLMVMLRLMLLVGVVIVLGGAITTVMFLRGILAARHQSRQASNGGRSTDDEQP